MQYTNLPYLIKTNNKLSLKVHKARLLDFVVALLLFCFVEFMTIKYHLGIIFTVIVFISAYIIQDTYKRGANSIDIVHISISPYTIRQIINQYILLGIAEYKSILILLHAIIVFVMYNTAVSIFVVISYIAFSIYLALHSFLIKRYPIAYQVLVRSFSALSVVLIMIILVHSFGNSENSLIVREYLSKIELGIMNNITIINVCVTVFCFLVYIAVIHIINKLIQKNPFMNAKNVKKANRLFY